MFSPDGAILAVSGSRPRGKEYDPVLTLWDAASGRHLRTLPDASSDFSPDGKHLATPYPATGEVVIRDIKSWAEVRRLKCSRVESANYSPDGKHLLSHWGHYDRDTGRITGGEQVWNLADGRVVFEPTWEKDERCEWHWITRDGRLLMATNKQRLRTWNPRDGSDTSVKLEGGERLGHYTTDLTGTRLLYSGVEAIQTLDMTNGKVVHTFGGDGVGGEVAWLTDDGTEVVTTSKDGRVVIFDAANGRQRHAFFVAGVEKGHPPSVHPGPDPRWLVVHRSTPRNNDPLFDSWVSLYTRGGRLVRDDQHVITAAFDPAGRRVAVRAYTPELPGRPSRMTVTLHDAAAWLAGGAKN
ncbi:WD40 repeat domain-containing protein [Urbifossiella limnaea]|uniref:WD40 repeat domain-containing protein n=1 Tax=Urbifossiella limnaea TaxID=2528023 RepID=UPI0011AB0DE5|nr:WD40 repeat domain-containing protein [Urbifossiella limnaea]